MEWILKPFADLTVDALYECLALRQRVFVVEQKCVYVDCDGHDQAALHLMGKNGGAIVAYARLLPPKIAFAEASIGRVVVDPRARGGGTGRALMREAVRCTREAFGGPVRIGAQSYLVRFYEELGFVIAGESYVEDGIPHVEMLLA
jgi:ElaA protein